MTVPTLRVAEASVHGEGWLLLAGPEGRRVIHLRISTVTAWLYDQASGLLVIHSRDGRYDLAAADPDRSGRYAGQNPLDTIQAILWEHLVGEH